MTAPISIPRIRKVLKDETFDWSALNRAEEKALHVLLDSFETVGGSITNRQLEMALRADGSFDAGDQLLFKQLQTAAKKKSIFPRGEKQKTEVVTLKDLKPLYRDGNPPSIGQLALRYPNHKLRIFLANPDAYECFGPIVSQYTFAQLSCIPIPGTQYTYADATLTINGELDLTRLLPPTLLKKHLPAFKFAAGDSLPVDIEEALASEDCTLVIRDAHDAKAIQALAQTHELALTTVPAGDYPSRHKYERGNDLAKTFYQIDLSNMTAMKQLCALLKLDIQHHTHAQAVQKLLIRFGSEHNEVILPTAEQVTESPEKPTIYAQAVVPIHNLDQIYVIYRHWHWESYAPQGGFGVLAKKRGPQHQGDSEAVGVVLNRDQTTGTYTRKATLSFTHLWARVHMGPEAGGVAAVANRSHATFYEAIPEDDKYRKKSGFGYTGDGLFGILTSDVFEMGIVFQPEAIHLKFGSDLVYSGVKLGQSQSLGWYNPLLWIGGDTLNDGYAFAPKGIRGAYAADYFYRKAVAEGE